MSNEVKFLFPMEGKSIANIYSDGHAEITLSGGEIVMIDAEDASKCIEHKWYLNNGAIRATDDVELALNRLLMNAMSNDIVRYNDGNKLNCRKANLNKVTKGASQSEEALPSRIIKYPDKGYAEIVVTRKGYKDRKVKIDLDDVEKCEGFIWKYGKDNAYCPKECNSLNKHIALHRYIMNAPEGKQVVYRDRDIFNCRKSNLLCLTHSEVQFFYQEMKEQDERPSDNKPAISKPNKSAIAKPVKPVVASKPVTTKNYKSILHTKQGYIALLQYEGETEMLGPFDTKEEAVTVYENKVADIYMKADPYGLYEEN